MSKKGGQIRLGKERRSSTLSRSLLMLTFFSRGGKGGQSWISTSIERNKSQQQQQEWAEPDPEANRVTGGGATGRFVPFTIIISLLKACKPPMPWRIFLIRGF